MTSKGLFGSIRQMQKTLDQLAIPLAVAWNPDPTKSVHGEIKEKTLFIYDGSQSEAWSTFTHEVCEYKLKDVTQVYRTLVNLLIEGYEKLAYQQKEGFIDNIPRILETIARAKLSESQ